MKIAVKKILIVNNLRKCLKGFEGDSDQGWPKKIKPNYKGAHEEGKQSNVTEQTICKKGFEIKQEKSLYYIFKGYTLGKTKGKS